jgi:hypothetical protein
MIIITVFVLVFASAGVIYNRSSRAASVGTLKTVGCAYIEHPTFQNCWYYKLQGPCGWYEGHIVGKLIGYPNYGWKVTVENVDQEMKVYNYATCTAGYYEGDFQFDWGPSSNPDYSFVYDNMARVYHNQISYPADRGYQKIDPNGITNVSVVLNSMYGGWHQVQHVTIPCPVWACMN